MTLQLIQNSDYASYLRTAYLRQPFCTWPYAPVVWLFAPYWISPAPEDNPKPPFDRPLYSVTCRRIAATANVSWGSSALRRPRTLNGGNQSRTDRHQLDQPFISHSEK